MLRSDNVFPLKENKMLTRMNKIVVLQPGLLLPGSIRKVMDYGVFVDLGGGLVGLAPNKVYVLTST